MSEKTPYRAENDKKVETHSKDWFNPNSQEYAVSKKP